MKWTSYLLVIFSAAFLCTAQANEPTASSYATFVDNLNAHRFFANPEQKVINVTLHSAAVIDSTVTSETHWCVRVNVHAVEFEVGGSRTTTVRYSGSGGESCQDSVTMPAFQTAQADATRVALDPEHALLLHSVKLNGEDILKRLVEEASSPDNIVFQTHLPDFLGGSTFIASRAFSGVAVTRDGNTLPNSSIGIGVFITDNGVELLSPITFVETLSDIEAIEFTQLNLQPIVSGTGVLQAEGIEIVAIDSDLPFRPGSIDTSTVVNDSVKIAGVTPGVFTAPFMPIDVSLMNVGNASVLAPTFGVKAFDGPGCPCVVQTEDGTVDVGGFIPAALTDSVADGVLAPGETLTQHFVIRVTNPARLRLLFDVRGIVAKSPLGLEIDPATGTFHPTNSPTDQ